MVRKRKTVSSSKNSKKKKTEKILTVKKYLNTFIKDPDVKEAILKDTHDVSLFAFEASRYIYFDISHKFSNYYKLCPHDNIGPDLVTRTSLFNYIYNLMDRKHTSIQNETFMCNLRWSPKNFYNQVPLRSALFNDLIDRGYQTVLKNNIWMHAQKRFMKYLKHKYQDDFTKEQFTFLGILLFFGSKWITKNEKTMNPYLRELSDTYMKNNTNLFNKIFEQEDISDGYFCDIEKEPLKYMYRFFKIQMYNEQHNLKNFILIPLYHPGRVHINYSNTVFLALLKRLNKLPKSFKTTVFKDDNEMNEEWRAVCNQCLDLKERSNRKFKSFSTNGVDVSIRYTKQSACKTTTINGEKRLKPTTSYAGIDPGKKLFIAGVMIKQVDLHDVDNKENFYQLRLSSKEYQHESRNYYKFYSSLNKKLNYGTDNSIGQRIPSSWYEFIKNQMTNMAKVMKVYMSREVTKKKMISYIAREKTLSQYISKHFLQEDPQTTCTVFYGDGSPNGACIKGYIHVPNARLVKKLENHPNIQLQKINEYNTTKLCSYCDHQLKVSKSPDRYAVCPNCHIIWNRDINAGYNILKRGLKLHKVPHTRTLLRD